MKKTITVLGSTGSIGRQTLETAEHLGNFEIAALTAGRNSVLLEEQCRRFSPALAALEDESAAADLRVRLADTSVRVLSGREGVLEAAALYSDVCLSSIVGLAGLMPTLAAISTGNRRIALANKETLVCGGHLVKAALREHNCELIPVDSEHSAIFQSLMSGNRREVRRILLTASGGPFRGWKRSELQGVTPAMALKHPNWSMGAKITIDSATMMNKGLEIIEAMHLFDVEAERIRVLIHPESILHSGVEFCDGAVIAQLGLPDMRLPIQLAMTYPQRVEGLGESLDLCRIGRLTFQEPDPVTFSLLGLAQRVAGRTDAAPVVMNGANEAAVDLFLREKIGFTDIFESVEKAVDALGTGSAGSAEEILQRDREARQFVIKELT